MSDNLESKLEKRYWIPFIGMTLLVSKKQTELRNKFNNDQYKFYSWLLYQTISSGALIYLGFIESLNYISK